MYNCTICGHVASGARHHGYHQMDMHHRPQPGPRPEKYARATWRHNASLTGVIAVLWRDGEEPQTVEHTYAELDAMGGST